MQITTDFGDEMYAAMGLEPGKVWRVSKTTARCAEQ
jgi:hypothetical protein